MDHLFIKLFEVRIWHDYFQLEERVPDRIPFGYDINDFISITPSGRTRDLLEGYQLLYKPTKAGFVVIARSEAVAVGDESDAETFIRLDERLQLTFYLSLKDPYFFNYTNLPLKNTGQLFYFHNLRRSTVPDGNQTHFFLTNPLPAYDVNVDYQRGDLVRADDRTFEVIDTPVTAAPDAALNDQPEWARGKNTQYVTADDRLDFGVGKLQVEAINEAPGFPDPIFFTVKTLFNEEVKLGFKDIPGEEIPIEQTKYPAAADQPLRHTLYFQNFPEGVYHLSLDGDDLGYRYVIPPRAADRAFGVIEIFHTTAPETPEVPAVPDGYGIVDHGNDANNLLSKPAGTVYHLHFKSRMTYWRYIRDSSNQIDVLSRPLSLTRGFQEVELNGNRMPNPDVLSLLREVDDQNEEKFFSNVYV